MELNEFWIPDFDLLPNHPRARELRPARQVDLRTNFSSDSPISRSSVKHDDPTMASSSSASSSRPDPAFSTLAALQSTFVLRPQTRSYNHQYANMYFARLVQLRQAVLERAEKKWGQAAGEFSSL